MIPNQQVKFTTHRDSFLAEVLLQVTPKSETATRLTPMQATVSTICGVTETHCVLFMRDDYPSEDEWATVVEADFEAQVERAAKYAAKQI